MGFFTWTLANKKTVTTKSGEYAARCKLKYDGYGAILCPDSTLIQEECYDGYGMFGGKDVYELVVDWNREHLTDIPKIPGFNPSPFLLNDYDEVLSACATNDDEKLNTMISRLAQKMPYLQNDWKRTVGIFIACENNHLIPYPIKIVDLRKPVDYASLPPSISTQ